jgi:hypothetical protein
MEIPMEARKVAAQFAAYVWFENTRAGQPTEVQKVRFARENWHRFLPIAPEGLGRLLLRIARGPSQKPQRRRLRQLTVVG